MITAAFAGCAGKRQESPSQMSGRQNEEQSTSAEITIEIISDPGNGPDETREEEETAFDPESEESSEGTLPEEESQLAETETMCDISSLVSPGDMLEEKDIRNMGTDQYFTISPIPDSVFRRMDGVSYRDGCPVSLEDLRYLRILHYDFGGNIRVGELVCNKSVSEDMLWIFRQLYEAGYPIDKVLLIDEYGGDDDLSSSDNNTSCFNYRTVANSSSLSLHALGVAVDINPVYNPYITWREEGVPNCAPANGTPYMDRSQDFPYKIDEEDICCQLFLEAGFTWGGSWEGHPDYMHFSRGARPEQ